jgi:anti-sigma B factor antagonist
VELQTEQMNDGTMKINLLGRLDIVGTNAIDLRFTSLTATRKANVIVDLSGVDFLSSMGVRLLLSNAKALASRGGKMVICTPDPMVRKVLETTGTDAIIPLYDDVDSAHQALKAP